MHPSFGSTGDAFDNAAMETFWARLKVEIAWIRGSIFFNTRAEAHAYLFEFIEVFHNRQRHKPGLSHLTPTEFADKWRHDHGHTDLLQPRVQDSGSRSSYRCSPTAPPAQRRRAAPHHDRHVASSAQSGAACAGS